jgi:hypothetical protein
MQARFLVGGPGRRCAHRLDHRAAMLRDWFGPGAGPAARLVARGHADFAGLMPD